MVQLESLAEYSLLIQSVCRTAALGAYLCQVHGVAWHCAKATWDGVTHLLPVARLQRARLGGGFLSIQAPQ